MIGHPPPDGVDFVAWAEGIKGSRYGFFGRAADEPKPGAWARRANHGDGEEFRWLRREDDDSDTSSPKLWEQGGSPAPGSPKRSPAHHQLTARQQTIAMYRQEMMDLVKDAPESAYELSLRDMVELPRTGRLAPEKGKEKKKAKEVNRRMSRSNSMETGGFLLNLFLPFSFGGKGRKERDGGAGAKVSPKPGPADGGEWCGNKEYRDRSSSSGSGSSSSTCSSARRKFGGCCYSFLTLNKARNKRGTSVEEKSYG